MREVVIVSAVRTAIGAFGGSFKNVPVTELGGTVIAEAVKRAGIGTEDLSEVIMGNILQGGLGQNPARQAAAAGGVPFDVPSMTINKVCGSGLKAVNLATQALLLGDADIIAAGGMESMSRAGFVTDKPRWGKKMGNIELIDMMINDGLWDVFNDYHMGITAENVAERWDISREAQDEFAAGSQQKAEQAIKEGKFAEEIVPVTIPKRRGEDEVFKQDEHPRFGTTKDKLANLRPAFKKEGTVTAGNASGINDGAAALVLTTKEKAKELGLKPLAVIKSYASAAVDPEIMGIGPVPATRKALKKTDLKLEDIDLIEANEAFASQSLAVLEELKLNPEIVNVNGGAIALGHPIGASGARILVTLLHEMQKRRVEYGLATLCIGGGMGTAVIIKRSE